MYTEDITAYEHFNYMAGFDFKLKMPDFLVLKNLGDDVVLDKNKWIIRETVAIKKIDGIDVSFYAYWNGGEFINKIACLRYPGLLNGDQGLQLKDNLVTIFPDKSSIMNNHYKHASKTLINKQSEYVGYLGFDTTLLGYDAYYKKIHFDVSYDILYCLEQMYGEPEIKNKAKSKFVCSQRIYDYPYNIISNMKLEVIGGIEGDETWIIIESGDTIKDCWNKLDERLAVYPDICFRTDGSKLTRQDYNELKRKKYL
jgi:hypothetical protein